MTEFINKYSVKIQLGVAVTALLAILTGVIYWTYQASAFINATEEKQNRHEMQIIKLEERTDEIPVIKEQIQNINRNVEKIDRNVETLLTLRI